MPEEKDLERKIFLYLDIILGFVLIFSLLNYFLRIIPDANNIITVSVSFIATFFVVISAARSFLKNRKVSVDFLASFALLFSIIKGEWVSVLFINLMVDSARIFSNYVSLRSHSAIKALFKLKPHKATIEVKGELKEVAVDQIKRNDTVIVELGERIPVDGIVKKGEASIDQSSLTGESEPVLVKKGDRVLSSTIIVSGSIILVADKVGQETTIEKIINLVEKSQENKAKIETFNDKFAEWYIIFTFIASTAIYLFFRDINVVLSFLLVSCADDIAVATPLAFTSSIINSAKKGAIFKGGNFLEGLAHAKTVVVDKTGTLTKGKLKVRNVFVFSKMTKKDFLKIAAIASFSSHHPVAKAVVNYTKTSKIPIKEPSKFEEYSGKGVVAFYRDKKIIAGKISFLRQMKVKIAKKELSIIENEEANKFAVNLVAMNGKLLGFISLEDELRPGLVNAMEELKDAGIEKIVMLTGDNEDVARKIAESVGIKEFHANLLPSDKIKYLKKYINKKNKTVMIGDGVNDAPALSLADIGIAMGAIGSDAAIESADIALMKDNISQVPDLIRLGKTTLRIIRQNILIWVVINVVGIILVFSHTIGPSGAAVWNFATDFLPIFNSLRLITRN